VNDSAEQTSQPFVSHLVELRNRVMWALGAVLVLFICLVPFAKELYAWFAAPLIANIPEGSSMIAIDPHATLFTPFKLAFAVAFAIAVPFVCPWLCPPLFFFIWVYYLHMRWFFRLSFASSR